MIELVHMRSADERHYELPDGSRVVSSQRGMHYLNHDGRGDGERGWRKCDPRWDASLGSIYGPYSAQAPASASGPLAFANLRSDGQAHNNAALSSFAPDALPVAANVLTNGICLGAGVSQATNESSLVIQNPNDYALGSLIDGTREQVILAVRRLSNQAESFYAGANWLEQQ